MKSAPNYIPGEAVNGKWKEDLLKYLAALFNLKILVETGTCEGSTLLAVHKSFDHCYSIELSEHYFNKAWRRTESIKNISLYKGNSGSVLSWLLKNVVSKPSLFWLDAHSSGGKTANEGDPLPDEIKAIIELSPDSLVVIDDEPNDKRVKELIPDGWTTEYRTGIVLLYKKGLYNIPDFE